MSSVELSVIWFPKLEMELGPVSDYINELAWSAIKQNLAESKI
jgi:hypothetical protein